MLFLREGIEGVEVFILPDGVFVDGHPTAVSRAALVTWRSSLKDLLYQVYANDRFAGVTVDAEQRQLVIQVPTSFEAAVHVAVVAVDPKDAHVNSEAQIDGPDINSGRVRLTLLRSQTLPIRARVNIYFDNGTGTVDYTEPLNAGPIPLWPCWQDKAGFGMASFGPGDFGYDSAASVGFGKGSFGNGQFGLDADAMEWISPVLPLGRYRFGVRAVDERGNESTPTEIGPLTVVPPAKPAAGLDVVSLDPSAGQLILGISDSA